MMTAPTISHWPKTDLHVLQPGLRNWTWVWEFGRSSHLSLREYKFQCAKHWLCREKSLYEKFHKAGTIFSYYKHKFSPLFKMLKSLFEAPKYWRGMRLNMLRPPQWDNHLLPLYHLLFLATYGIYASMAKKSSVPPWITLTLKVYVVLSLTTDEVFVCQNILSHLLFAENDTHWKSAKNTGVTWLMLKIQGITT